MKIFKNKFSQILVAFFVLHGASVMGQVKPTVTSLNCQDNQTVLLAQGEGIITWYGADGTTALYKGATYSINLADGADTLYVEDELNGVKSEKNRIIVANTGEPGLSITSCGFDFFGDINNIISTVNNVSTPFIDRTNGDKLPCATETGTGERLLNIFSYVGPLKKDCNRVLDDACGGDANRQNYWVGIVDDRRAANYAANPYDFRIIWGGVAGNYTYYGSCFASEDEFDNELYSVPKLIPGCNQNHSFQIRFFQVNALGERVDINKGDIEEVFEPYLEDSNTTIPGIDAGTYSADYNYGYVAVDVKLKNNAQPIRAYVSHNYAGTRYFKWKGDACQTTITEINTNGWVDDAIELQTLTDIYNSTGGANWTNNTNWLQGTTMEEIATWHGVTVVDGDVVKIELPSNNLIGSIPIAMGNFTSLSVLNFNSNQLSGTIPSEIGGLVNLKELRMGNNQLTSTLPTSMSELISLELLWLNDNSLDGVIPAGIWGLTTLKELALFSNALSGNIPTTIGDLVELKQLLLYENNLSGTLPSSIGNLTDLEVIDLHQNNLTGILPESITNLSSLTTIGFQDNTFTSFPDFHVHVSPGNIAVQIQNNYIPQVDIDANIDSGTPIFSVFTYNPQQEPNQSIGLVGQWSFDGDSNDHSGNNKNGIVEGGATLTEGRHGTPNSAYYFDGVDDYVDLSAHDDYFKTLSKGSISMWFKATPGNYSGSLISLGNTTNDYFHIYIGGNFSSYVTDESIGATHRTGGSLNYLPYVTKGSYFYNDDTWHHLVFVMSENFNKIYIDDVLQSLTYGNGIGDENTGNSFFNVVSDKLAIGRRFYPGSPSYFKGSIDEVRIYDRAITATEVSALYDVTEGVDDALELQALTDLYNSTDGANWINNTNWLQGTTMAEIATWHGVTVVDGDVTKVELSGNELTRIIHGSNKKAERY